ncbi:MAG: hypothetical protein QME47_01195 [Candidatus Thermoplasmatota archaeon]|nr:hypothetical protein [Candidatus Thermoplasmatota archaeon]
MLRMQSYGSGKREDYSSVCYYNGSVRRTHSYILGLVRTYLGFKWALALYALNLIVIFLLGRMAFKLIPSEPMGLIMEMPPYRKPILRIALRQNMAQNKRFYYDCIPVNYCR